MLPLVATTVVEPGLTAVASPGELFAVPIVAMLVLEELQVTVLVNILAELSLYVPVAMNCAVAPLAMVNDVAFPVPDRSMHCG